MIDSTLGYFCLKVYVVKRSFFNNGENQAELQKISKLKVHNLCLPAILTVFAFYIVCDWGFKTGTSHIPETCWDTFVTNEIFEFF